MSTAGDYNRIAPIYDFLVRIVFGNKLARAERYYLGKLTAPTRILIFGGGTGKILRHISTLYPESKVDYLEASSTMIALASKQAENRENIKFIHGTEKKLSATKGVYDVVITPFVLDVFAKCDLEKVLNILFESLVPGGYWIQTDFYVYQNNPWWQRALVHLMYQFFRLTAKQKNHQLPDFTYYFNNLPVKLVSQKYFCSNMVRAILYAKFQETEPSH